MRRFKGLNLVDRVSEELWTKVHNSVQEAVTKANPKKKKCKKGNWLSDKALKTAEEKRKAREKGKNIPY